MTDIKDKYDEKHSKEICYTYWEFMREGEFVDAIFLGSFKDNQIIASDCASSVCYMDHQQSFVQCIS